MPVAAGRRGSLQPHSAEEAHLEEAPHGTWSAVLARAYLATGSGQALAASLLLATLLWPAGAWKSVWRNGFTLEGNTAPLKEMSLGASG